MQDLQFQQAQTVAVMEIKKANITHETTVWMKELESKSNPTLHVVSDDKGRF